MDFAAGMRFPLFISGAAIVALGIWATRLLEREAATGFLTGALTLGGGLIICGLFSLKMPWHGWIGGGVLALLGAARGAVNLAALPAWFLGDRGRGAAPLLEAAVAVICIALLVTVVRALKTERGRRMLADEKDD